MSADLPVDTPPAVLIVNDQPNSLVALTAALDAGPWRVVTTGSGLGAFKELLIEDFAVIVLDVRMPGLSGFEVAEMIRTRPRCAATPIIFCTASARAPDDHFKGYELGAVDYLLTPIPPHALRSKVAVFVELFEQKRRLARTVAQLQQARAALEMQNRELRQSATRDPFTGCLNRRGFALSTAPLFDAVGEGSDHSFVAVDVDRLSEIAETHGRGVSDACVRRVVRLLSATLRDRDHLCRWRDEQFVVALGHTTLDDGAGIAARLCDKIRNEVGPGLRDAPQLHVTASIGVTSTLLGAAALESLVEQTEIAIRAAKQAGGDTVRRYDRLLGEASG